MSKIGERIQEDSVGMRWIRTAATTIVSTAAAGSILWGVLTWLVAPRVDEWAHDLVDKATLDLQQQTGANASNIDKLDKAVDKMGEAISVLSDQLASGQEPAWVFIHGATSVGDGKIGSPVSIVAVGRKLRECGVPRVDLYFIDAAGNFHRFSRPSVLSPDGRGIVLPVRPDENQTVSYTAIIPDDEHVTPGRAQAFISLTYPDGCPNVREAVAGPLQFRIERKGTF